MKKPLIAVVLAAGIGKRFWPLTVDKTVFPFIGKPFLTHAVIDILPSEVDKAVCIVNPNNRSAIQAIHMPVPVTYCIQEQPKGMADALLTAKSMISGSRLLIYIADHYI